MGASGGGRSRPSRPDADAATFSARLRVMGRKLALLRGVNVGGRVLPMAALRELCTGLGWREVRTYIQSGNVVFESDDKPAALEAALEAAITERFGFKVQVIVRTPAQWAVY